MKITYENLFEERKRWSDDKNEDVRRYEVKG